MEKKFLFLTLVFFIALSNELVAASSLIMGSVSFPKSLRKTPPIRIYASGQKLLTEIDADRSKIIFSAPKMRNLHYYILVTDKILLAKLNKCKNKKNNTIEYLKIDPQQPYKLYSLTLIKPAVDHDNPSASPEASEMTWHIEEQVIDPDGRVPDHAIIIFYPSEYIQTLQGGTEFELPTIVIKKDITRLVGSEQKLMDLSNMLLLSSIDADTLHASVSTKIAFDELHHRTIILPAAA